ncbi:hypothetical protein SLEP1_g9357 [Rubroshorea leprosula]|uniref:Protein CHUP1, chloroplastic n=1 Tax=Rubroshorea leprosula TaxID=152421 RepID=A0AAV5IDZ2_9ROSI|nr:hypothetical protein SLEP1_g9357 [Rubroshorea leprosula]
MKQLETPATVKPTAMSTNASIPSRYRARTPKEAPKLEARPKTVPLDGNNGGKIVRSLGVSKPKSGEQQVVGKGSREDVRVVEQFARPKRSSTAGSRRKSDGGAVEEKKNKELSDALVKDLQAEVLSLKAELDKAQSLNVELEAMNRELALKLAAAEAKLASFESRKRESIGGEYQSPKFKDIQRLIACKLEQPKLKREAIKVSRPVETIPPAPAVRHPIVKAADAEKSTPLISTLPTPPPPPPPPRPPAKVAIIPRAPSTVQLCHSSTKQACKSDRPPAGNHNKPPVISVHSSIVGEIQNRSAHLLAIKADIETKGEFINSLIQKVSDAAYTDIEDVLKFVDWLDNELLSLADERAVLKHFKWPERKADAMREAAFEYRDLKLLEHEISSYKDDPSIPCGVALKKMAGLLDKSEQSTKRLIKLRNSVMRSYQDWKIPVDWMLDSGIMSKIKKASMKLATMYIKRVAIELEFARRSDRESTQEALLLQGMHFAYRAHQFAGGLDSETLCAFEEIRQRVPSHLLGSKELLAGIPLS